MSAVAWIYTRTFRALHWNMQRLPMIPAPFDQQGLELPSQRPENLHMMFHYIMMPLKFPRSSRTFIEWLHCAARASVVMTSDINAQTAIDLKEARQAVLFELQTIRDYLFGDCPVVESDTLTFGSLERFDSWQTQLGELSTD